MRSPKPNGIPRAHPRLRCAIYTRKSSEEGLEQDFNSLDAQREACEAYVASQRHEGWGVLPQMYDDGGFSGATMERPALQQLLADVAAGQIDVVVVYKVDRLTRSLSDFAKIVEIFDKRQVSFVSVTQAFNTTTSMGRLTLNVLLSFAQFEREVTGERIRDKIAASKRKGMWMGGQPPLGYDAKDRKLVVNEAEAEVVRHIFRRYCELKSVRLLKSELDPEGILSKVRLASDGSRYGGRPLARGALYLKLANRIYRGEIVHKGQSYPGDHAPIIDEPLWNEVQQILSANRVDRESGANTTEPSLCRSRLRCRGRTLDADARRQERDPLPLLCLAGADHRQRQERRKGATHPCRPPRGPGQEPPARASRGSLSDARRDARPGPQCSRPEAADRPRG
jgi:site-specific DNA recombinase